MPLPKNPKIENNPIIATFVAKVFNHKPIHHGNSKTFQPQSLD